MLRLKTNLGSSMSHDTESLYLFGYQNMPLLGKEDPLEAIVIWLKEKDFLHFVIF